MQNPQTIKGKYYDAIFNDFNNSYEIHDCCDNVIVRICGDSVAFHNKICATLMYFGDVEDIMNLITTVVYMNRRRNDAI